jgi:hypothetical protein
LKPPGASPHLQEKPREPGVPLLAASVAHELNNIAASLRGFIELAREHVVEGAESPLGSVLEEFCIGVERVAALGADITTFAASGAASPRAVTLDECASGQDERGAVPIRWECDAGLRVHAAVTATRQAIGMLGRFAGPDPGSPPTLLCHREPAATTCASCGAACAADTVRFTLLRSATRVGPMGLPSSGKTCLSAAELRLTALDHAAHAAGGHLLLKTARGSISLLLPMAETANFIT